MTAPYRVLVVDDDDDVRELLCELLERNGFEVMSVESGEDALALITRLRAPCTIVLDLGMPDVSGWEVLDLLRSQGALAKHPVVIVSGHDRDRMPAGVPHVRKPVDAEQLLRAVRAAAVRADVETVG